MNSYPTRLRSPLLIASSRGWLLLILLQSLPFTTLANNEKQSFPSMHQPCINNAPVTNDCVEEGLRRQRETLRELPEFQADTPESHITLAGLLMQQGDPNGAIEEYQAAVQLDPTLAIAYRDMGAVYLDKHEWKLAEEALRTSVTLEQHDSQAHYWLGRALLAQQQFSKASQAFEIATQLDDRNAEYFSDLALAFMAQGEISRAEQAIRQAISLKPDLAEAHLRLEVLKAATHHSPRLIQSTLELLAIYFRRE